MAISFNPFLRSAFKRELVDFFKNVSVMAQSGIPLNEALGVLIPQARSRAFRSFILKTKTQLEHGSSFSQAMTPYADQIGGLSINIIRAGELNGTLEQNLKYLADILTRNRDLKNKISSALLYPEILLVMTFCLGAGISMFVLPKLIPLFTSLKVELPLATRILLAISLFLRDHGLAAIGGVAALVFLFFALRRVYAFRWALHTVSIRLPFFGRLFRNYQLALFCQIFGTLFRSGLTIKETMVATANAMTNLRYRNALQDSLKRLTAGIPLATLLARYPKLFTPNVIAIVSVGEKSGKLEDCFEYLAQYFDNEVDLQTTKLPTLLEPVLLIGIGLVVAFVAIAIISPIYELTSGISVRK